MQATLPCHFNLAWPLIALRRLIKLHAVMETEGLGVPLYHIKSAFCFTKLRG